MEARNKPAAHSPPSSRDATDCWRPTAWLRWDEGVGSLQKDVVVTRMVRVVVVVLLRDDLWLLELHQFPLVAVDCGDLGTAPPSRPTGSAPRLRRGRRRLKRLQRLLCALRHRSVGAVHMAGSALVLCSSQGTPGREREKRIWAEEMVFCRPRQWRCRKADGRPTCAREEARSPPSLAQALLHR